MKRQRIYSLLVGLFAGAWPFWILALVGSGERWPTWVALVVAVILSAAALRTPAAWTVGIVLGVVFSWALLAILIGTDWRLAPYVIVSFSAYYLAAAAGAIVSGYLLLERRGSGAA
jgi:uncharacterized membrane protein (UPF0136 family)